MLTVDHYEVIRREHVINHKSIRQISRELGHSRKTVRKAIEHSAPPPYKTRISQTKPMMGNFVDVISNWLAEDVNRPRKQRHTAKRIFDRLKDEHGFTGSYVTVARHVRSCKGFSGEVFMPLYFSPGEEAQVDWGEARILLNGVETKVHLFCMRLCHSQVSFVRAYKRQDQVSFLDGHVHALRFFGGVPRRLAYDNLTSAVIVSGRGSVNKRPTEAFRHLKSHYLFDYRFCSAGKGNEKGHVENLVKFCRLNFLVPLPEVTSLAELNVLLMADFQKDMDCTPRGWEETKAVRFKADQARFYSLPQNPFSVCRMESTFSSRLSLVRFDNCFYSIPCEYIQQTVLVKGFVDKVEVYQGIEKIAEHIRCEGPERYKLDFRHYLSHLERKPGWLKNGRAFLNEPYGSDFGRMRRELSWRYPDDGERRFIQVLLLLKEYPEERVYAAVSDCVRSCAFSDEAVRHRLISSPAVPSVTLDFPVDSPFRTSVSGIRRASCYNVLLGTEVAS